MVTLEHARQRFPAPAERALELLFAVRRPAQPDSTR